MGGKKNVKIKSYTTACDWLLATAPLLHLLDVWSDKDHYALGRADLSLVVASGAVNLSGHIPATAIARETHTIPSSGPYTIAVAHAVTFVTALGNPPVEYRGAQAMDYSGANPPGPGEFQVAAGVYTFNGFDAGQVVDIEYAYSTGAVDDANFFAVLGVAAEISVDETFTDFGDPAGSRTRLAVQRRWLWNTFWDPPEAFEPAYGVTSRAPWEYTVSGLSINVDPSLNGKTLIVRVAFRIPTSSWDGNPLSAIPFGGQFEPQLGSGSEYVNHPTEQTIYPDCSGVGFDRIDLGTGASYPQASFEATGYLSLTADGDCNPADLLMGIALLGIYSNPAYSGNTTFTTLQMLALSLAALGLEDGIPIMAPLDDLRAFCEAYGIYVTGYFDQQRGANDWFNEICEIANAAVVASGFQVKIIPYCERSEAGNGVVYNAPSAAGPVYDFTDRDFLDKKQPVKISIKRSVDQYNVQPVGYINRDNDYADAQTTGADQGGVYARMTQRAQPKSYKTIFTPDVADKVAIVLAKKQSIQANEYAFEISSTRYPFVEAMDVVTLTDDRTGLKKLPVRITEANEGANHKISCKAEDFFYGLNAPQQITSASQQGTSVETDHQPGPVNPPPIFMNTPKLNGGNKGVFLTIGLSGASEDWGGALVWVSLDGTTYNQATTQVGRSVMGLTGADLPLHADPDTADDLPVDLTESLTTLDSYSAAYEDEFVSLCYIEGSAPGPIPYELIAYGQALLTGANQYTLKATGAGNKIRRGVYATPIADHPLSSKFLFMGGPFVRLQVDPKWFGQTVHFKFTSFNSFGKEVESLADVTDYPFAIPANPLASDTGGFYVNGGGAGGSTEEDLLDWITMDSRRATFHLHGTAANYQGSNIYSYLDPATHSVAQIKSPLRWACDIQLYDPDFIYQFITELDDAGYPFWSNGNYYKKYNIAHSFPLGQALPIMPRFWTPGQAPVDIVIPGPNPYNRYVACGLLDTIDRGPITCRNYGPITKNFDNDGFVTGNLGPIPVMVHERYAGDTMERFQWSKGLGFIKWEFGVLISGGRITGQYKITNWSVHNQLVAGGGLTPAFGCGYGVGWP
jgi:Putative phage tail protein